MKVNTLCGIAAMATTVLVAGTAEAGLIDMRLDLIDSSGGLDTYRLIGTFASGLDRVDAIGGDGANPFNLTVGGAGIVNDADLVGGAGNADRPFQLNGARDTWITIGQTIPSFGPFLGAWSPDPFGIVGGESGTQIFTNGLTSLSSNNTALFVAGGRVVNLADDVLATEMTFMQISVASGTSFSISGFVAGVNENTSAFNNGFSVETGVIPAPGALALLGLAGLVGRPRRRRA